MTRRRFFSMTPVQTVPGRSVELSMQLQPIVVPAPAPAGADDGGGDGGGEIDVIGAAWLWSLSGGDSGAEQMEDNRWLISGYTAGMYRTAIWEGEPFAFDEWEQPVEGPGFRCVELALQHIYYPTPPLLGVLQGRSLPNARWEVQWDNPSADDPAMSLSGHRVSMDGNMLWVVFKPDGPGEFGREILDATAFCGGQQVGALRLMVEGPM